MRAIRYEITVKSITSGLQAN